MGDSGEITSNAVGINRPSGAFSIDEMCFSLSGICYNFNYWVFLNLQSFNDIMEIH